MITIENLEKLGANTAEGVARCLGKEDFYIRMVTMALSDDSYEKLKAAVEAGDLREGFEKAHSLKGILTNVSLTSLAEPVIEITEELRAGIEKDYGPEIDLLFERLAAFRALLD